MASETTPVAAPVSDSTPALNLYAEWREPVTTRRVARAAIGSAVVHLIAFAVFVTLPDVEPYRSAPIIEPDIHKAVHLVAPKFFEPTQTAPNKGKISRELDVRSAEPAPQPQAPRFLAPQPALGPVAEAKPSAPAPPPHIEEPKIEAPKIQEAASAPPPVPAINPNPPPPAPQPPAPQKPKLAFESVGAGYNASNPNPVVPDPRGRYQNPLASGGGATMVGDAGASDLNAPGINSTASPGRSGSNLQLLSDAKGVDFRPYLIQVLTAVRRNWLAILPDGARMGQHGRVLIQFAIDRNGSVPKVVIAEGAGADALDRAAVAAISASYPFPPLPVDYKGDQIRLQFAFSYNMPR